MVPLGEVAQHWAAGPSRVCMQIKTLVVGTTKLYMQYMVISKRVTLLMNIAGFKRKEVYL